MDPVAVLASLGALGGGLPPRTLVVGVQPADIAEGIGLSPPVREAVARAVALVRELVDELVAAVPTTAARGRTE
jgi:hydrogenase maturation protease